MTIAAADRGRRVLVHWNKHKDCFSVLDAATRRLQSHKRTLAVEDARFVVRPGGRDRARREGRRNVHAFVAGRLADVGAREAGTRVGYTRSPIPHSWRSIPDAPLRMRGGWNSRCRTRRPS